MTPTVLVTGGAGFVGSALVRQLIRETDHPVVNVDKLTYAGNLDSLAEALWDPRHCLAQMDICDDERVRTTFQTCRPAAVLHLAAESHVDRSIDGPAEFVRTNVVGTYAMLAEATRYWRSLPAAEARGFRFLHVSTDEVYGSLGSRGRFHEETAYNPSSPYSASKASSDHLVRAWHRTYGLPVLVTTCCNNYGPYQFPEKLIPLTIERALADETLPVYGLGDNVRDWLYVEDHVRAIRLILERGVPGRTYNVGANNERTNIEVVRRICTLLDELRSRPTGSHARLISFVADRPGHDRRYAIDATRLRTELGWTPREAFTTGLRKTVQWYLDNREWIGRVMSGAYRRERLGAGDHE